MSTTVKAIISGLVALVLVLLVALNGGTLKKSLSAVSGPDMPYSFIGVNGLRVYPRAQSLTIATSTVCAIQSPTATSTLLSAGIQLNTGSTTASTLVIAKAATAFATTTTLASDAVAANSGDTLVASSTPTTYGAYIFAPSQWVVFGMSGGTGVFSPTGTCHATFESFEQ